MIQTLILPALGLTISSNLSHIYLMTRHPSHAIPVSPLLKTIPYNKLRRRTTRRIALPTRHVTPQNFRSGGGGAVAATTLHDGEPQRVGATVTSRPPFFQCGDFLVG
mmetsp:Transcript_11308/g.20771  ORF Transcript_11308/g.20771 Transcript_11308/m.20771 type:complete len:107 (-) Transcript_11308:2093-2413(-)